VTSNTQIKVRKNVKIKKIKTPSGKLDVMYKISKSSLSETAKENIIRRFLDGGTLCCICRGIPTHEVTYNVEKAIKIERYCDSCVKELYEREAAL
jgi:hypothetical protein